MRFAIEHEGRVTDSSGALVGSDELDVLLDEVMDLLLESPEAIDADMSAALATGDVTIRFEVDADTPSEAVFLADSIVRAVLHGAGVSTKGWKPVGKKPNKFALDWSGWHVEPHDRLIDAS